MVGAGTCKLHHGSKQPKARKGKNSDATLGRKEVTAGALSTSHFVLFKDMTFTQLVCYLFYPQVTAYKGLS